MRNLIRSSKLRRNFVIFPWFLFLITSLSATRILEANNHIRTVEVITIFAWGCIFGVALSRTLVVVFKKGATTQE